MTFQPALAGRPATGEAPMTDMIPTPAINYQELREIEEKFKEIALRTRKAIGADGDVGLRLAREFLLAAHKDPELQAIVLGQSTQAVVYAFLNHLFWTEDVEPEEHAAA
jgi:hypothetical protein